MAVSETKTMREYKATSDALNAKVRRIANKFYKVSCAFDIISLITFLAVFPTSWIGFPKCGVFVLFPVSIVSKIIGHCLGQREEEVRYGVFQLVDGPIYYLIRKKIYKNFEKSPLYEKYNSQIKQINDAKKRLGIESERKFGTIECDKLLDYYAQLSSQEQALTTLKDPRDINLARFRISILKDTINDYVSPFPIEETPYASRYPEKLKRAQRKLAEYKQKQAKLLQKQKMK